MYVLIIRRDDSSMVRVRVGRVDEAKVLVVPLFSPVLFLQREASRYRVEESLFCY